MQDSWFWRAVACVGLVAALGYVVSRFTSATPVQAQGGSVIAVTETDNGLPRLFIVDLRRNVILVYGGSRGQFTLLASRYFEADSQATVGMEFPFRTNGYTALYMKGQIKK